MKEVYYLFSKLQSFAGGIYPPHRKHLTENRKIEICKAPDGAFAAACGIPAKHW